MQAYKLDYNSSGARLDRLIDGKWQSERFAGHDTCFDAHKLIVGAKFALAAHTAHLATWQQKFDRSYPKVPTSFIGGWCHIGWQGWQIDLMRGGYSIQYYDWKEGRLRVTLDGGIQLEQSFAGHRLKEIHVEIMTKLYAIPPAEAQKIADREWRFARG